VPSANEALRDALLSHQIGLNRLSNQEAREILAILLRVERQITRAIRARLRVFDALSPEPEDITTGRLRSLMAEILEIQKVGYGELNKQLRKDLIEIAHHEVEYTGAAVTKALPADLRKAIAFSFTMPSPELLSAIVTSQPFQGKLLKGQLTRFAVHERARIRRRIAEGLAKGDTVDTIMRQIWRKDMPLSQRQMTALVRTTVGYVTMAARREALAGNEDVVKGYQWLSTLDLKTTLEYCVPRDGKPYDLNFKPVGHGYSWDAGPGAIHWNCRSSFTTILKSWEELGVDANELTGMTRASMDGQVPRETTSEQWLRGRNLEELEEVFGKTRAQLFTQGHLTVDDMVKDRGGLIKLSTLRRRELEAFKDAGLA
jgi:hypothetical protein